ncbi:MAG: hypothetical protein GEV03_29320 [Streptosporangiales bacterium]|nr:hypothetical protein [Streptosporangiales bacterium]
MPKQGKQSYRRRLIEQLRAVADELEAEEEVDEAVWAEIEAKHRRGAFRVIHDTSREPCTVAQGSTLGPRLDGAMRSGRGRGGGAVG